MVIFASASLYIMWKYSAIYSQCIALCCRMPISVQILFSREPTCDTSTPPIFLAHAFFSDHPAVIRYKILTPYIFFVYFHERASGGKCHGHFALTDKTEMHCRLLNSIVKEAIKLYKTPDIYCILFSN